MKCKGLGWTSGKHAISTWLIYRRMLRNNNLSEINNNLMSLIVGVHPTYWKWYLSMQVISALAHVRWGQLKTWDRPKKQKEREYIKTQTLNQLWDRLDNDEFKGGKLLHFLALCSRTYKFYFDSVQRILNEIDETDSVNNVNNVDDEKTDVFN